MQKKLLAAMLIILAAAGAYWGSKWYKGRDEGIKATGTIEVTRFDIAPKVSGYLVELSIQQGDKVEMQQFIARIARPDLEAQVLRDEAALHKAEAQLQDLVKGSRNQELAEAFANVAAARSTHDKALADLQRYNELYRQGAISQQQLEASAVGYETAKNALKALEARMSIVEEGNRPDAIEAQRLEVERSKAVWDLGKSQLADTVISSPGNGVVLSKNYEPGEFVNAGSAIATIGDLLDCWVKVYIPSTQMGLLTLGQAASIKVDSYPDRVFSGKIKEISQNPEFMPRQSLTQNERANMVFAVKVRIQNDEGILKPGMPADVVFQ